MTFRARVLTDHKVSGFWECSHGGTYKETLKAVKEIFVDCDLTWKDLNSKDRRDQFFHDPGQTTADNLYKQTNVDLATMSCLTDVCVTSFRKSGKNASDTPSEKTIAEVNEFLDKVSQMNPWQVVNFGFGTEAMHGVKDFDENSKVIWDMHVRKGVTIMNPVGLMGMEAKEDHWHNARTRQNARDVVTTLTQGFEYVYFLQGMDALAGEVLTGDGPCEQFFSKAEAFAKAEWRGLDYATIFADARNTVFAQFHDKA